MEYHEELELDLADRGVDVLDLWRGRLSFRRLELLIRDLACKPADSRLWSKLDPDAAEASAWGVSEYLAALQVDILGKANFQNWKPIPRPADGVMERRRTEERHRRLVERYEAKLRGGGEHHEQQQHK